MDFFLLLIVGLLIAYYLIKFAINTSKATEELTEIKVLLQTLVDEREVKKESEIQEKEEVPPMIYDKCPACGTGLSVFDASCPECGLNIREE